MEAINWEAVSAVSEALGLIVVFGSLIFVGLQIRQSTDVAKANAYEEAANNWLINTTKSTLASSQVSFQNGKVSHSFSGGNAYS